VPLKYKMTTRKCTGCEKVQTIKNFPKLSNGYHRKQCTKCFTKSKAEYNKKYYSKKKQKSVKSDSDSSSSDEEPKKKKTIAKKKKGKTKKKSDSESSESETEKQIGGFVKKLKHEKSQKILSDTIDDIVEKKVSKLLSGYEKKKVQKPKSDSDTGSDSSDSQDTDSESEPEQKSPPKKIQEPSRSQEKTEAKQLPPKQDVKIEPEDSRPQQDNTQPASEGRQEAQEYMSVSSDTDDDEDKKVGGANEKEVLRQAVDNLDKIIDKLEKEEQTEPLQSGSAQADHQFRGSLRTYYEQGDDLLEPHFCCPMIKQMTDAVRKSQLEKSKYRGTVDLLNLGIQKICRPCFENMYIISDYEEGKFTDADEKILSKYDVFLDIVKRRRPNEKLRHIIRELKGPRTSTRIRS